MIDQLKQFGKVEICKEENRTFHIKITDGFQGDMSTALSAINLITDNLAGKYTRVVKMRVKENDFELIAKR